MMITKIFPLGFVANTIFPIGFVSNSLQLSIFLEVCSLLHTCCVVWDD